MGGKQNSSTFKVFQGAYEPCDDDDGDDDDGADNDDDDNEW